MLVYSIPSPCPGICWPFSKKHLPIVLQLRTVVHYGSTIPIALYPIQQWKMVQCGSGMGVIEVLLALLDAVIFGIYQQW